MAGQVATGPGDQDIEASEQQALATEPPIVVETEDGPFEDITLEGERISIESILGIDAVERSSLDDSPAVERSTLEESPADEDDPTDEFAVLREVPDSAYPVEDDSRAETVIELAFADAGAPVAPPASKTPPAARTAAAISPGVAAWNARQARSSPAVAPGDALASEPSLSNALAAEPTRVRRRGATLAWAAGGLLLALGLVAQVTQQFRQDLVRHPQIGPLLKDVYARIGVPLSPNWDLAAFELRQWGNGGGPDVNGHLTVRASLTNRAAFAQPHPILRLELDDRFGDAVAVRDFEPAEYLKNPAEASRLIGPAASAEAELVIVDPGQDAVGYQLDVCLRESATILRCAQGPG